MFTQTRPALLCVYAHILLFVYIFVLFLFMFLLPNGISAYHFLVRLTQTDRRMPPNNIKQAKEMSGGEYLNIFKM